MRWIVLLIVVGFPLAEGALLYRLAAASREGAIWVGAWVVFAAMAGAMLIKHARFSLLARLGEAVSRGRFSLAALIDSFRTVIAGLLLMFPGVMSDLLALVVLLLPVREPVVANADHGPRMARRTTRRRTIDGEFHRE
jgi:UPF0716 protein FxsA